MGDRAILIPHPSSFILAFMIYLDNAATSFPKPPSVHEGATKFMQTFGANPGRGGHKMAVGANRMLEETRLELARFFNAGDTPERMIFTMNCTDGLNIAIKGLVHELAAKGKPIHVITSHLDRKSTRLNSSHIPL